MQEIKRVLLGNRFLCDLPEAKALTAAVEDVFATKPRKVWEINRPERKRKREYERERRENMVQGSATRNFVTRSDEWRSAGEAEDRKRDMSKDVPIQMS